MAYQLLLVVIAIWASGTCSSPPGPQNDSLTSLPPVAQPLRTDCMRNADCPINNFCEEGRSQRKRCVECVDCEKFQRKPKKSYDGETCATHHTQCGECNAGYEESGGVCIPKAWIPNVSFPTVAEKEDVAQNENETKKEESVEASATFWVTALLIGVFLVTVIFAGATKLFYHKPNPTPIEEEAGLTSYPNSGFNGPYEQPPSAPPLEYHTQPAHYSNGQSNEKPSYNRIKAQELFVNAIPFNNGFAATDGNDYMGMGDDDPVSLPDSVDGAAASTPADGIPTQNANPGQNNAGGIEREVGTSERHFNTGGTRNQSLRPRSNQQPSTFGRMQPEGNAGTQDPVYFSLFASLGVTLRIDPSTVTTPSNEASYPSSIRSIASAPTSPSPRLMDDTHVVDLPLLQGSFVRSNVSMDSGTGTSEHDRSVPSRSISQGFSDLDESYLYDDGTPSTLPQRQAVQVPQQGDEYQLQQEEPMDFL